MNAATQRRDLLRPARRAIRRQRFRIVTMRRPLTIYRHRGLSPSDVFLATYPRSGTTWMRFILFEILSGDSADFYALQDAIPYIGRQQFAPKWLPDAGRLIQTHESYSDRDDRKIIFLVRDPRSVVVSQYYWYKRDGRIAARGADDFVSEWIHGSGVPWDSWARHASFWLDSESARNNRLHLVRYEDLKRDPMAQIQGVLGFLGVSKEPAVIRTAIDNNTLERMKAKEETRSRMKVPDDPRFRFIRSGSTSGWRKELSAASQRSITEAFHDTLSRLRYETDLN